MTDRELLELAAKAAGMALEPLGPWFIYSDGYGFERMNVDGSAVVWRWSPLTNDGDALRLAVKLRVSITHNIALLDGSESIHCLPRDHDVASFRCDPPDYPAAVRRCIVEAAAKLGESME